jgi:hypothetical protein
MEKQVDRRAIIGIWRALVNRRGPVGALIRVFSSLVTFLA